MKITRTEQFRKDFLSLPNDVRKAASKQVTQLLIDHRHPSLNMERIKGRKGLFSVGVNRKYRMSLLFEDDETIILRRVLDHDNLYKNP